MKIPGNITVVAIQNYGSSGTMLLHSLLDNHPKILMTPATYSRNFFYFWEKNKGVGDVGILISNFIKFHYSWFKKNKSVDKLGLGQMGKKRKQSVFISQKKFDFFLTNILGPKFPSRKVFFIATYLAYAKALGKKPKNNSFIIFPIHSLPKNHAVMLREDCPGVKFIYMIREPLQNILSHMKHVVFNGLPVHPFESAVAQILNDCMILWGKPNRRIIYGYKPFSESLRKDTAAFRLEDLHDKPSETLKKICTFIGIKWHKVLLQSTFDGKLWWNRPESPRISGFNGKAILHKISFFNKLDLIRLNCLLYEKNKWWDYRAEKNLSHPILRILVFLSILIPFKPEVRLLNYRFKTVLVSLKKDMNRFIHIIFLFIHDSSWGFLLIYPIKTFMNSPFKFLFTLFFLPFIIVLPVFFLILFIFDYINIRKWLYKSWFDLFKKNRREVKLYT